MFSLNGSKGIGVFENSTINVYLGNTYISYTDKKLSQMTVDKYDTSSIEPSY